LSLLFSALTKLSLSLFSPNFDYFLLVVRLAIAIPLCYTGRYRTTNDPYCYSTGIAIAKNCIIFIKFGYYLLVRLAIAIPLCYTGVANAIPDVL
jgi:hypothetical protein